MKEFKLPVLRGDQLKSFKKAFNCFERGIKEFSDTLSKAFNMDQRFLHNIHMAKYSKKKRIRKKYLRKLMK